MPYGMPHNLFLLNKAHNSLQISDLFQAERHPKLPQFWIYDHRDGTTGYSTSFYYRTDITEQVRDEKENILVTLQEASEK